MKAQFTFLFARTYFVYSILMLVLFPESGKYGIYASRIAARRKNL